MDKRSKNGIVAVVAAGVVLGGYALMNTHLARDTLKAWNYAEPVAVNEVREKMQLTGAGERIFLATVPALEVAEDFNEHCQNQRQEVSLLGCYTEGKIYIYDVQSAELDDVKKVTAAHELMHAVWARLNRWERSELSVMLQQYAEAHAEWVEGELEFYSDEEKVEELYARVATKVREIPAELEEHYRKYFQNRQKIVEFYENYQAPFEKLRAKCLELKEKTETLNKEIVAERERYDEEFAELKTKVEEFNRCASVAGCFGSEEKFLTERRVLESEGVRLQRVREELNQKIDSYNEMVMEYESYRLELGELTDSMNSKINKVSEGEL